MTTILGVIGWPVAHSKSPLMHGAAIAALGLDARYLPFPVHPSAIGDAMRGMRALGIRGLNVTLPHKAAVMEHLDHIDDDARVIGAVNTIVNDEGSLRGFNTDAPGLVRSIEEAGVSIGGRRVGVLGAGGAARAAIVGIARAGAASLTVFARRSEAAERLAGELSNAISIPLPGRGFDALEAEIGDVDLLVQASSATLGGGDEARRFAERLPLERMPSGGAVVELVYDPLRTTVLERAEREGLATVDGLGMLLHQGAIAFERFLGQPAPVAVMGAALGIAPAATMSDPPKRS